MTPEEIDRTILLVTTPIWQKVAMVIAKAADNLDEAFLEAEGCYEAIAERVYMLVELGKLDSQGNVRNWRFSEVKLPD